MKIFLTGSRGMVGSNIIEHADAKNHIFFSPSRSEVDLSNKEQTRSYISDIKPDLIIHAAGTVGGIQDNISRPVSFLVDNMQIGLNIVTAAYESGVETFLNIGSSCMYPRNIMTPLTEDLILKGELEPTNEGYALAKITCAKLCEYINRENSALNYKTIIPCNLYGRHDKFDPIRSHMIPAIIAKVHDAVKNNLDTVEIWGTGKARREFMYAGDLADFIFYSLDKLDKLPQNLNVGLGYDYEVNYFYEKIAEIIGFTGGFSHDLSKPSGMTRKLVDVSKLEDFGWKAGASLEDGIRKTYKYYIEEVIK